MGSEALAQIDEQLRRELLELHTLMVSDGKEPCMSPVKCVNSPDRVVPIPTRLG